VSDGRRPAVPAPAGEANTPAEAPAPADWQHDHRKRLRRRFLAGDAESLPDYELLELLLFATIPRIDVKPLAKSLLAEFGSLGQVLAAGPERLKAHNGRLGEQTAALFKAMREVQRRVMREAIADRPVLSSWAALLDYCRASLAGEPVERFRILFLDRRNRLIRDEEQQRGTVDHTPLYPREVVKRALELGATALILVHNHPSGDPTPSTADVAITREVMAVAEKLGIVVHDHVVVAQGGARSLRSLGLI
jgi:DNA repair protein RadC